jgi:cation:H+ antiporter
MPVAAWSALFAAGVAVSLAASWVLVTRLERLGERAGISEALLGVLAALAADAPEITAAVTALARGQASVGVGVVIGSNVFNLAALLGVAAMVAGQIALHRRVVLLSGAVGVWIAVMCVLAVLGVLTPLASLLAIAAVLVPYLIVLGMRPRQLARLPVSRAWTRWLTTAIHEQEAELEEAIHPGRGSWRDGVIAAVALLVVVAASTLMERAATIVGGHFGVPGIVTGGLVLAVVTSLPNAVAAIYLARRGRGAAVLSTALNSNALNVAVGLLLPAAIIGLGPGTGSATLVAAWYTGLTLLALILAWRHCGLSRGHGALIVGAYLMFVTSLLASVARHGVPVPIALLLAGIIVLAAVAALIPRPRRPAHETAGAPAAGMPAADGQDRTTGLRIPGWSIQRVWGLSFLLCLAVAALDAATGPHLILIGVLIVGPCCALLTGRWRRTALTGVFALSLGALLGVPDGIFNTYVHYAFLAAIAVVTITATLSAAYLQRRTT